MNKQKIITSVNQKNSTPIPIGMYPRNIYGSRGSGCNNLEEQLLLGCNKITYKELSKIYDFNNQLKTDSEGNVLMKEVSTVHFTDNLKEPHYVLLTVNFQDADNVSVDDKILKILVNNTLDVDDNSKSDNFSINPENKKLIITLKTPNAKNIANFTDKKIKLIDKFIKILAVEKLIFTGKNGIIDISTKTTLKMYNNNNSYYVTYIDNESESSNSEV